MYQVHAKEITGIGSRNSICPCYKAHELPPLNRRITPEEYEEAVRLAHEAGLYRLDERRARLIWLWA